MTRHESDSADHDASQDDAVWLDLVARLESDFAGVDPSPDPAPAPPRPFRDFDPLGLAGNAPAEPSAAERAAGAPGEAGPLGPRDYDVEDDDGEFVPEEPPSLAGTDPLTVLAWCGALGGPLAIMATVMFWRSAPLLAIVSMVAAFVFGVAFLIMKLPQEKADGDDGARV